MCFMTQGALLLFSSMSVKVTLENTLQKVDTADPYNFFSACEKRSKTRNALAAFAEFLSAL